MRHWTATQLCGGIPIWALTPTCQLIFVYSLYFAELCVGIKTSESNSLVMSSTTWSQKPFSVLFLPLKEVVSKFFEIFDTVFFTIQTHLDSLFMDEDNF